MTRNWKPRSGVAEPALALPDADAVFEELLRLRGITTAEDRERFLTPDYDRDLHDPFLFAHMERVMDRLRIAKESGERIGIFGDFDADGITSTILLSEGLAKLGIPFSVYLPDKHAEGHGLSESAIERFADEGVALIMTVDCGISNSEEVAMAKEWGIETIIIDHHLAPETLPNAYAIVNPKVPGEPYPFKDLCGAGVTFKVLQAIYATFFPDEQEQLKWFLDVAAVGTVADVMPLVGENRIIVSYGLIVLSKTRRPGFRELVASRKVPIGDGRTPTARDVAFHIAPRLNAASRMDHPRLAHDLLVAESDERAEQLACELEAHNAKRQEVSDAIARDVRKLAKERGDRSVLFAADPSFYFGVVGLVAGRIANEFAKPTVLLTRGETESKGSLRSIPGLNIIEVLEECSDLLDRFGGHAAAAGITLPNGNLLALEERMERLVAERIEGGIPEPEHLYDLALPAHQYTLDLVRGLRRLAPFGEGNPEPVFLATGLSVTEARPVGKTGTHLKLLLATPDGRAFDAIGFSLADRIPDLAPGDRIDALFQLDENEWNGRVTVQLKLVDIRRSEEGR
jgi:single-stranded-DNA-specific exonuclease